MSGTVSVRILDKDYQFQCPSGEEQSLVEAARLLDGRMRKVRDGGRTIGLERIAVMVALNLANELLTTRESTGDGAGRMLDRVRRLNDRIDGALRQEGELAL